MRGQRHTTAVLYPRETPGTHCTGNCVGPRARLDRCGKSRPPTGFDPQTFQPVASRYTDYATRPTKTCKPAWNSSNIFGFTVDLILRLWSDSFFSKCWVILNIKDLALSCIQLVPAFVTWYLSDATFNQKRSAGNFPSCWCTLATFIMNIVTAMCRNLTQ